MTVSAYLVMSGAHQASLVSETAQVLLTLQAQTQGYTHVIATTDTTGSRLGANLTVAT